MKIDAALLKAMSKAGVTSEQIAMIAEEYEAVVGDSVARRREKDRNRQALRRAALPPAEWAELRDAVLERDEFRCVYCGEEDGPLHADHVIPITRGGESTLENLVCACCRCNSAKQARTPEEWGRR